MKEENPGGLGCHQAPQGRENLQPPLAKELRVMVLKLVGPQ